MMLIPKMATILREEHYRPIAISNFVFKVITRIIVDCLGITCSKILSSNQYGFVKGCNGRDAIVGVWSASLIFISVVMVEVWKSK